MPYADKEFQKLYDKEKYRKNRERYIANSKKWNRKHKKHRRKYLRQYVAQRREKLNAYHREWKRKQSLESKARYNEVSRKWRKQHRLKNPEMYREQRRKHRRTRIIQHHARETVMFGVRYGFIQKPDHCSHCKKKYGNAAQIHAHHWDYSKPLEFEWLCHSCHLKAHSGNFANPPIKLS